MLSVLETKKKLFSEFGYPKGAIPIVSFPSSYFPVLD